MVLPMVYHNTNVVQGSTNGTIGNTIGTNGNDNGTIGSPNGTIGKPMVPLGEPRTEPETTYLDIFFKSQVRVILGSSRDAAHVWFRFGFVKVQI